MDPEPDRTLRPLGEALRHCPTPIDGRRVLFAHKLSIPQCQDRQRGHYHKCFTCVFNNAIAAKNGAPAPERAPAASGAPAR